MSENHRLTESLGRGNPDVLGILVVDGDGTIHASETTSPEILRAAVAMTVPLRDLLDRAAAELGCGELASTLVEGREASFAIADVDGFRSVVVIGTREASLGSLRSDSLWLATRLREGASA